MPFGISGLESQRDSIIQPRVATPGLAVVQRRREELPWVNAPTMIYPNGVASSPRFVANLNFRKALGLGLIAGLLLGFAALHGAAQDQTSEFELIQDNHFHRGFILWQPQPGQHVRYGELPGFDTSAKPVWGLAQWTSKFPLAAATRVATPDGSLVCTNSAKGVILGPAGTPAADVSLSANSRVEYGATARKSGDPWVHLLAEQEFGPSAPLAQLKAAKLHVEARLSYAHNLHQNDYQPSVHAAQFQIFFTVQNRNQQSPGYGDMLWFGIPIYDNRNRFPEGSATKDFGGSAKFIFTPSAKTFTSESAHDGNWITLDKDLLPLMNEALAAAWSKGFLPQSKKPEDYHISGMNMGWELPGTFDVRMQIRNLSLKLSTQISDSERPEIRKKAETRNSANGAASYQPGTTSQVSEPKRKQG